MAKELVEVESRPGFVSVSEYLELPSEPEAWLLKPLIPAGGAALLYGDPKTGKSWLAIQLSHCLSSGTDFLGFGVPRAARILYLQLDTPRTTWRMRFADLAKQSIHFNDDRFKLADRECLDYYPFDILKGSEVVAGVVTEAHKNYLFRIVHQWKVDAVIVDTLRECHRTDENDSTSMQNVISNLVEAVHPAALIIISHAKKPSPDVDKSIINDNRGSNYTVGRMDAIMRMTKTRLYYSGRTIEDGSIKLEKKDYDGVMLFEESVDIKEDAAMQRVLYDPTLPSLRAKGKALAPLVGIGEEAAISRVKRYVERNNLNKGNGKLLTI